jgi:hypothetical protein
MRSCAGGLRTVGTPHQPSQARVSRLMTARIVKILSGETIELPESIHPGLTGTGVDVILARPLGYVVDPVGFFYVSWRMIEIYATSCMEAYLVLDIVV